MPSSFPPSLPRSLGRSLSLALALALTSSLSLARSLRSLYLYLSLSLSLSLPPRMNYRAASLQKLCLCKKPKVHASLFLLGLLVSSGKRPKLEVIAAARVVHKRTES